jgi:dienelactone hydrolase
VKSLTVAAALGGLLQAGCTVSHPPFPPEPAPGSLFRAFQQPATPRPVAAVVLLHTCAGVLPHLATWASRLVEAGYAVLTVDSFTPRGVRDVCNTWSVSVDQVAGDAFAALDHLRARPGIDPDRIGVIGFSYGAMATLRTSSPSYRRDLGHHTPGFRAAVAVYPVCVNPRPDWPASVQERLRNLYDDLDTPTQLLMGAADTDTPAVAANCATAVERLRSAGRPVGIKLYAGVGHAFDMRGQAYDPEATRDAMATTLAFLARHLAEQGPVTTVPGPRMPFTVLPRLARADGAIPGSGRGATRPSSIPSSRARSRVTCRWSHRRSSNSWSRRQGGRPDDPPGSSCGGRIMSATQRQCGDRLEPETPGEV